MHTPRSSTLLEILASIPVEGVGLDELAELANRVLEARGIVVRDGRAADRVDARTIRFYQTIGIVPKPAYEGRRAIYDRDHLVRVVAAKSLQAEGYSLAQIQGALPLRQIDDLTQALVELEGGQRADGAETRAMPHVSFDAPRAVAAAAPAPRQVSPFQLAPFHLAPFNIAPGVTVLIDPTIVPDPHAIAASLALALRPTDAFTTQPRGGRDASVAAARGHDTRPNPHGGNQ
jgi:DNA-binding transcriptional MerR regulator